MTKTERVRAALCGEKTDHIPFSFWTHMAGFDLDPELLAQKTYEFARSHDIDFIKTMNNGMYSVEDFGCTLDQSQVKNGGVTKLASSPIHSVQDWAKICEKDIHTGALGRELTSLRSLLEKVNGEIPVVFTIMSPKTLCIVGESGSGKSVTSLGIMRLLQTPPGHYAGGQILFEDEDILTRSEAEMRRIRGSKISMIFQEPMSSLNPVLTIGYQIMESIRVHQHIGKESARKKAVEMLSLVGITDPEKRLKEYPHQMSGGMRQRVMIAIALSCNPQLLIADEPTTALDVTIQAQILRLLKALREKTGMAIMLITHDLGVVAEMADEVVVLYAGKVMERGTLLDIFDDPQHPYTKGLIECIPKIDERRERLITIEGTVPKLGEFPTGCRFSTRCPHCQSICRTVPPEFQGENGHLFACHFPERARKESV